MLNDQIHTLVKKVQLEEFIANNNPDEHFKKFDKNGTGYLTESELKTTMLNIGIKLSDAQVSIPETDNKTKNHY